MATHDLCRRRRNTRTAATLHGRRVTARQAEDGRQCAQRTLDGLRAQGLRLGVMTNDTEYGARAHLTAAGVLERFDFVAGFDSGHGAKPAAEPLLAFARAVKVDPARVVMVGDSTHDLIAGRRAGMACIGVLTGTALAGDLAPHADAVLPDIGHLPGWLAS